MSFRRTPNGPTIPVKINRVVNTPQVATSKRGYIFVRISLVKTGEVVQHERAVQSSVVTKIDQVMAMPADLLSDEILKIELLTTFQTEVIPPNVESVTGNSEKPKQGEPKRKEKVLGETEIKVGDFLRKPVRELILAHPKTADPVLRKKMGDPTFVVFHIPLLNIGTHSNNAEEENNASGKHVMLMTRGTRGDIQPFVALARGLATQQGYTVTICSELRFRDFVMSYAQVPRGKIQFRPCGGDTSRQMGKAISQWAVRSGYNFLQWIMMAKAEQVFYPSEPVFHHWANTLKPDVIVFGFTVATMAHIIGQSLSIPIVGFVLQPTNIPSTQYAPVEGRAMSPEEALAQRAAGNSTPIAAKQLKKAQKSNQWGHRALRFLKGLVENMPGSLISEIRKNRGLDSVSYASIITLSAGGMWKELQRIGTPLIVPVDEEAFGGRPKDWAPCVKLTKPIFLRDKVKGARNEEEEHLMALETEVVDFIAMAKSMNRPVVSVAFSSMPVSRDECLTIAKRMATECKRKPCVIALNGNNQGNSNVELGNDILEIKGAPFNHLFPFMDAAVIHGGLGTVTEALYAGIPVVCTGVMLMDQRFWGKRLFELGVGPPPLHINKFMSNCVEFMNSCLDTTGEYYNTAKSLALKLQAPLDPAGLQANVEAISAML